MCASEKLQAILAVKLYSGRDSTSLAQAHPSGGVCCAMERIEGRTDWLGIRPETVTEGVLLGGGGGCVAEADPREGAPEECGHGGRRPPAAAHHRRTRVVQRRAGPPAVQGFMQELGSGSVLNASGVGGAGPPAPRTMWSSSAAFARFSSAVAQMWTRCSP